VTSACKIDRHLALGSRNGTIGVYDPEKYNRPICTWAPENGPVGDAITSILNLSNSMNNSNYFLTTGRNGAYCIFSFTFPEPKVNLVHQGAPPFGPMIEYAWFSGSDLILYGFKSKNFIVWNETKQYEIMNVECGGAHRSYAYSPTTGGDGAGYFIFTKASKLYLHAQFQPSHQIIQPGGHGREIKPSAVSPDGLIATGAEDTAIRIWRYRDGKVAVEKQFNCLTVVQKHTTGIQHLQWYGSNYLFSSGGNEEFFIWAVESIPGFGIGLVCEATCPDQSEEKDLRIMSFDVGSLPGSKHESEMLLISLAYSDSTIRCYMYSKAENFRLLAAGRYTSSCLTQLRHLKIEQKLFFLTAGTDGHVTLWKTTLPNHTKKDSNSEGNHLSQEGCAGFSGSDRANDSGAKSSNTRGCSQLRCSSKKDNQTYKFTMLSNHKLHQSSIKSLDIITKDNKIVVATGGDDNALGATVYDADNLEIKPRSTMLRSAHAAAITGLSFLSKSPSEYGDEMIIVTSSNDQRVKEWVLGIGVDSSLLNSSDPVNDSVQIRKVGDVFTSVADVGDVTNLIGGVAAGDSKKVLVVGNGMEVYEVSL
jgi:hypothetical protein